MKKMHTENLDFSLVGLWPTETQMNLLEACIFRGDRGRSAIEAWSEAIAAGGIVDAASFRLLPLAYINLSADNYSGEVMTRLNGLYRMTRLKAEAFVTRVTPILDEFESANLDVLVLKGYDLAETYYPERAGRPMSDIDLTVKPSDTYKADRLLGRIGFERDYQFRSLDDCMRHHHALSYKDKGGFEIDLHWRAIPLRNTPDADDAYWKTSHAFGKNSSVINALSPTYLMFHTVVHGVRWNPMPPIRWIADAIMILRKAGDEIDWEAMATFAKEREATHRLSRGLRFLKYKFDANIPEDMLQKLEQEPLGFVESVENKCAIYKGQGDSLFGLYRILFAEHVRAEWGNTGIIGFLGGFLDYMTFRTVQVTTRIGLIGFLFKTLCLELGRKALGLVGIKLQPDTMTRES